MTVDTEKYLDFVHDVTSTESLDYAALLTGMNKLELEDDCNLSQLLTAALGLTAESGEFTEIVKKIILQGKPYNEDNVFHMKRELGDICWYIAQACMALDTTFDEIIEMNVDKLKKDLFNFRFQKTNSQVTNPAKIGETKKTIARLKTVLKGKLNA